MRWMMYRFFIDVLLPVIVASSIAILIVFLAIILIGKLDEWSGIGCESMGEDAGVETKVINGTCRVNLNGTWVQIDDLVYYIKDLDGCTKDVVR
jgi:hypothetical protein